ncbi:hypothetical protein ABLE68_07915 [Nocardioides sp. CN2-186]|uniref:hypothetical protein n=1 Tax=Nocardioides tweenelious TaxID=3156607 RepID=UPI0032B61FC4
MNKSVPMAAAGFAVLAVVASGLAGVSSANADAKGSAPRQPAQRAQVSACSGGSAISMSSRAMDFQSVTAGSTTEVEGSQSSVKGPKKGTDTILVTFTAMASSGGAGELTTASLYRDGVGTSEGTKYFTYNNVLDQATVQFCTKIGKGQHTLALRVTDGGGGATSLYYPTITYQRFS